MLMLKELTLENMELSVLDIKFLREALCFKLPTTNLLKNINLWSTGNNKSYPEPWACSLEDDFVGNDLHEFFNKIKSLDEINLIDQTLSRPQMSPKEINNIPDTPATSNATSYLNPEDLKAWAQKFSDKKALQETQEAVREAYKKLIKSVKENTGVSAAQEHFASSVLNLYKLGEKEEAINAILKIKDKLLLTTNPNYKPKVSEISRIFHAGFDDRRGEQERLQDMFKEMPYAQAAMLCWNKIYQHAENSNDAEIKKQYIKSLDLYYFSYSFKLY